MKARARRVITKRVPPSPAPENDYNFEHGISRVTSKYKIKNNRKHTKITVPKASDNILDTILFFDPDFIRIP